MSIRWHESNYREDHMIFDTLWEAEEWGCSISNDMHAGAFGGYTTPDEKVAYVLAFRLASVPRLHVHTDTVWLEDKMMYKVWVTLSTNAKP
ncbi:hypothetical protein ACFQZ1_17545 [Bacillus sp. CGMCC 1.60114]|uniref:hypothetical protein n=1 Tax=unclassified Bacillus (in: firmicutes) TaxID=185979 RepID=UPI00362F77DF